MLMLRLQGRMFCMSDQVSDVVTRNWKFVIEPFSRDMTAMLTV